MIVIYHPNQGDAAYKYDFEDSELVAAACEGLNPDTVYVYVYVCIYDVYVYAQL